MNKIYLISLIIFLSVAVFASNRTAPEWSADASEYEFNASIIARVTINNLPDNNLSSILGAFCGNECRGAALPIEFGDETLFFLTVYANQNGQELTFKFYQAEEDLIINLQQSIVFDADHIYGSVLEPLQLSGFSDFDNPPQVQNIPDQTISLQSSFTAIHLNEYLIELDGDTVFWTAAGGENLQVEILENIATISRIDQQWSGSEEIMFIATDMTEAALSSSDSAVFTVLPVDHPPQLEDIPDQTKPLAADFDIIDLNQYLIEIDDDPVAWSYSFAQGVLPDPEPDWSVDPTAFQANMSMTIKLISEGFAVEGNEHLLAAFSDGECRGIAQAQSVMEQWQYFLMIYADTPDEVINFQFYDQHKQKLLPVVEDISFVANAVMGNPLQPFILNAGNLLININDQNIAEISITDDSFTGAETVIFRVTDLFTQAAYFAEDEVVLTIVQDHAPQILDINDQDIITGEDFAAISLDEHLLELDGDDVEWTFTAAPELIVEIDSNNIAQVNPSSTQWLGNASVIFTVTDLTEFAASASEEVFFTIRAFDNPPQVADIPDQVIALGMNFTTINLNDYLTELDGDEVSWSYMFPPELQPQPLPDRNIDPTEFDLSLNLVAEVSSEGTAPAGESHLLYALCENECRGIASAVFYMNKWLYFITIYANNEGDEIFFEFYDTDKGRLLPVMQDLFFCAELDAGTVIEPLQFDAGRILVEINDNDQAAFNILDENWVGNSLISFTVQDEETLHNYTTSDDALFSIVNDHAPQIAAIPEQIAFINEGFTTFNLDDYLVEQDGDQVIWNWLDNEALLISIDIDNNITAIPVDENWTGSEVITLRAQDNTAFAAWDTTRVTFTLLPVDNAPLIADIPDQIISPDSSFSSIILSEYLTELDGDEITWTCEFVANDDIQPSPQWMVDATDYEYNMNLTASVISKSAPASGDAHILAAFVGEECRGIAQAVFSLNSWMYFITIYANSEGEELSFRFYDNLWQQDLPVEQKITFFNNAIIGDPLQPFLLNATFIDVNIDQDVASINMIDPDWNGDEYIKFIATDQQTYLGLSAFDLVHFAVSGSPFLALPSQFTFIQNDSLSVDMQQYIINAEPQYYTLTATGNQFINIEINNFDVLFSAQQNWTGSEMITFTLIDQNSTICAADTVEVVITTPAEITVNKEFNSGWNWFSINITNGNMNINNVLSSLGNSGRSIKNQTASALYYDGAGWFGSLTEMNNTSLYKLYCDQSANWELCGLPVDVQETTYSLHSGWNWISYAPQEVLAINTAFADLQSATSAKNQFQSAMYYPGAGWFGSLQYLQPLNGYMLYLGSGQDFVYPQTQRCSCVSAKEAVYMDANPSDFEYNAVLIAALDLPVTEGSHLVAKCNDQIRSICQILDYTEQFGRKFYSLMLYSNEEYEEGFELFYQGSPSSELVKVFPDFDFHADMIMGDFLEPVMIDPKYESDGSMPGYNEKLSVYPNPFNPQANIRFCMEEDGYLEVNIYNIKGQKVRSITENMTSGSHNLIWNGRNQFNQPCASGIYLFQLITRDKIENYRALLLK